ncbi:MAG: A24 family peptidase [Clostridia bacterium]
MHMILHYLISIPVSIMFSRLLVRPLRKLSYSDDPIFYDDMGFMLSVILSLSFMLSIYMKPDVLSKVIMVIFLFCLCCITYTDTQSGYIFDRFHIIICIVGVMLLLSDLSLENLKFRLFGCMIGGGFLELMNFLSLIIFKKEGIGGGDIKLCFACGFVLGISGIIYGFLLAFFPAAVYSCISKLTRGQEISLGPFLCISFAAIYCIGMA